MNFPPMKLIIPPTEFFRKHLVQEIGEKNIKYISNNYILLKQDSIISPLANCFTQNIWKNCFTFKHESIDKTVEILRNKNEKWILYNSKKSLIENKIQEKLSVRKIEKIKFPIKTMMPNFGYFLLHQGEDIIASNEFTNPFGNEMIEFIENKRIPSRAYLKLFEVLSLIQKYPKKNEICLDFGSSPGSWTFILSSIFQSKVYSVDKANLSEEIKFNNLTFEKRDVFKIEPNEIFQRFGRINWFFSDLICEPEKLLSLVKKWNEAEICDNFIVTIKFKGHTVDKNVLNEFLKIKDSKIVHLFHNKNELCWINLKAFE
jgi:23S rRNA (cytidine2498-2'-O)-methyltransferase